MDKKHRGVQHWVLLRAIGDPVVTPDVGSVAARLMRHRWWHFRAAHIGYFNHRTLAAAAAKAGLRVVSTRRPVWYFKAA